MGNGRISDETISTFDQTMTFVIEAEILDGLIPFA